MRPTATSPADATEASASVSNRQFARRVLVTFGFEAVLLVVALGSNILTARLLGPAGRGEYALVVTTTVLLSTFGQLGLSHSIVYHSKRHAPTELLVGSVTLSLFLAAVTVMVAGLVGPLLNPHLFEFDVQSSIVILLALPMLFVANAALSVVQGRFDVFRFNVLRLSPPVAFLALFGLLSLATTHDLTACLAAWLGAQAVFLILGLSFVARNTTIHAGLRDEDAEKRRKGARSLRRRLVSFGLKAYFGNVLKYFQYRLDVLIVGAMLDRQQLGYYAVALSLGEILWRIPNSIGSVLLPRIAGARSPDESKQITPVLCRYTFAMTCFLSALLGLLAAKAITVAFGPLFADAYKPLLLLLPGIVGLSVWKLLANDLIGQGYPVAFSVSALASVVVMVAGDVTLVPLMGIEGAAVASSVAYLISMAILMVAYRRVTGVPARDLLVLRAADVRGLLSSVFSWRRVSGGTAAP